MKLLSSLIQAGVVALFTLWMTGIFASGNLTFIVFRMVHSNGVTSCLEAIATESECDDDDASRGVIEYIDTKVNLGTQ